MAKDVEQDKRLDEIDRRLGKIETVLYGTFSQVIVIFMVTVHTVLT